MLIRIKFVTNCSYFSIDLLDRVLESQALYLNQLPNLPIKCYSLVRDWAPLYVIYKPNPKHAVSRSNTNILDSTTLYTIYYPTIYNHDHNCLEATLAVLGSRYITPHIQSTTKAIVSCFSCQFMLTHINMNLMRLMQVCYIWFLDIGILERFYWI